MILTAVSIYLAKVAGGMAVVHLIWDSRESKHLVFKFFLSTGVGLGISSLLYFIWFWLGFSASQFPYFELILFFILAVVISVREYKYNKHVTIMRSSLPGTRVLLWGGLLFLAIALSALNFILYALQAPHGKSDAWTIWNSAARFIYLRSDSWITLISKNIWFNSDYPLMLSLNIAEGWAIVGTNSTRIPIVIACIFVFSIIGLLFSSLAISKDFEQAALAAILISCVPQLPLLGSWQYADVPLSYFFLGTGAVIYLSTILGNTKLIVLAGLFAGLSAWTKNEGIMFAIISLCIYLILSIYKRKNLIKYFVLGSFFPVLSIILFKTLTPASYLFKDKTKSAMQLFDLSRYQFIFSKLISFIFSFGGWPISFITILLLYILLVSTPSEIKRKFWILCFLCLCQLASYFLVYLLTPLDLAHQINTSLNRLLFHIFPLTIFLVFNVLPSPQVIFPDKLLIQENKDF